MTSSWSNKLETRLNQLTDVASKESVQSLAKWIGFNRKHIDAFCVTLNTCLADSNETRKWLLLCIIHEVLILEKDNPTKWDRLKEARVKLGESVVISAFQKVNDAAMKARISPLIDEWEKADSFESPTLVAEMRKDLTEDGTDKEEGTSEVTVKPSKAPAVAPKKEEPKSAEAAHDESKREQAKDEKPVAKTSTEGKKEDVKPKLEPDRSVPSLPKPPMRRSSSIQEDVEFDFEGSGIPYQKVESREFLEPCKAIATLQIARDLRNDAAVQLSSNLSALPDQVKEYCRQAQESGSSELSEEQALEFAKLIGDDLLDTDMEEALSNVKTFQSIVEQQKQARQQLIHLLIQSRCQFGSDEAAQVYYSLDDILDNLKKRKQLLTDAMDLEGFEEGVDFKAHDSKDVDAKAAALGPLSWYTPAEDEPDAKRAKIE